MIKNRVFVRFCKSADLHGCQASGSSLNAKFTFKGTSPSTIFAQIDSPVTALQLCCRQFSHKKNLQQTFFKQGTILDGKQSFCIFEPPYGGLGATYDNHFRLIGKRVVDFLLVLT